MKKLQLLFIATLLSILCVAQVPRYDTGVINTNAVSALFTADGTLNANNHSLPAYFIPKDSLQASIYCGSLWVGGLDAGGQLHIAAQTYHQNGTDFWPGPIMDSLSYSTHEDTVWNHVWIVLKSTVDSFTQGKFGATIPASIKNWPGNGNTAIGEMATLAPYVNISNSGYYNPAGGDYPSIRGDEAMYLIFNDDRGAAHTETGGKKLGIEVHLMVYQFKSADTTINEATFLHYDIYNRSKNDYDSVYLGNWIDMDVGNGADNFIGCDSLNKYWYTYCGHPYNANGSGSFSGEKGYHSLPPAQSLAYMCDTMAHFMAYNNDFTVQGNPTTAHQYYNYLESLWRDSTHVTYGGTGYGAGTPSNYMYPGLSTFNPEWDEISAGDTPGDRRGISSAGPFTLKSKQEKSLDVALVFVQPFSIYHPFSDYLLDSCVTVIKNFYNSKSYSCDEILSGIPTVISNAIVNKVLVYPNPSSSKVTFKMSSGENKYLRVSDITGRQFLNVPVYNNLAQINVSAYSSGIYVYEILDKSGNITDRGKFSVIK
jgi:hypothetical protein